MRRFSKNPIIQTYMALEDPVININGPSLIRVPDWIPNRFGKYYLYFANHRGCEIHLAYAFILLFNRERIEMFLEIL